MAIFRLLSEMFANFWKILRWEVSFMGDLKVSYTKDISWKIVYDQVYKVAPGAYGGEWRLYG